MSISVVWIVKEPTGLDSHGELRSALSRGADEGQGRELHPELPASTSRTVQFLPNLRLSLGLYFSEYLRKFVNRSSSHRMDL